MSRWYCKSIYGLWTMERCESTLSSMKKGIFKRGYCKDTNGDKPRPFPDDPDSRPGRLRVSLY